MLIAARALRIGKKHVGPGEVVPPDPSRNFAAEVSRGHVLDVPDLALPAVLAHCLRDKFDGKGAGKAKLAGSSVQPTVLHLDGEDLALGDLVASARESARLSVAGWNALPDEAREMLIFAEASLFELGAEEVPALAAGAGADTGPGEPPEAPHILFDPKVHKLKYQGAVVGHTVIDKAGEILARVSKETYAELKDAKKAGRRAYAVIDEGGGE